MNEIKDKIVKNIPYFQLLSDKTINKSLRNALIKQAPPVFYDILTQTVRHLLNKSVKSANPYFCEQFENSLYILALPSTNRKVREKILQKEPESFIKEIFVVLQKSLP